MRKIIVIASLFLLSVAGVYAQYTGSVVVAEPQGSANATYKNAAKNMMLSVMQGMSPITATANATVDGIVATANINHNSTDVPAAVLSSLQALNNVDYVCYILVNENSGRIYIEAMLMDCSNGKVIRPQTDVIGRSVREVEVSVSKFAKALVF